MYVYLIIILGGHSVAESIVPIEGRLVTELA